MVTSVLSLHDVVLAKLKGIGTVNIYDGEIVNADGEKITPPLDGDGRVHQYAVLYISPGRRYASSLNGAQTSLDGSFQVTCAGGDPVRAANCVDKVRAALIGAQVQLDGVARYIWARDEDPGPLRIDEDKDPPRHYLPLEFICHAP